MARIDRPKMLTGFKVVPLTKWGNPAKIGIIECDTLEAALEAMKELKGKDAFIVFEHWWKEDGGPENYYLYDKDGDKIVEKVDLEYFKKEFPKYFGSVETMP